MQSLKEKSLLKLIKGKSLSEALAFCQSNQTFADTCFASPESIKAIITECVGPRSIPLFDDRADLVSTEQWAAFADGLSKGFSFKYCVKYDEEGSTVGGPEPYYNIRNVPGESSHEFYIEGLLPEPNSGLAFVQIEGYGGNNYYNSESRAFIYEDVYPNPVAILEWFAYYIAQKLINLQPGEIIISSEGNIHLNDEDEISERVQIYHHSSFPDVINIIMGFFESTNAINSIREERSLVDIKVDLLTGKTITFGISIDYLRF